MEHNDRPSPTATAAVAVVTLLLAFCALGFGRSWSSGVIGGGDAWQNLWNLGHVRRSVCDGLPLFTTKQLWAPEGASLGTHTLGLPFSIPAALVSPLTGLPLAYNLVVLVSFALAGAGTFRLARRLGAGNLGAVAAAICFAFAPPRFARAYGHLNLLGLGFLGFALEGLILTGASDRKTRLFGALEATLAFAALVWTDLYLGLLGFLAAALYGAFALVRETPRLRRAGMFAAVAATVAVLSAPLLVRVWRDLPLVEPGHESKWCSVALTSLVIPSRVQVLSTFTRPLTERNHQNLVEGVGYLGWIPLAAAVLLVRRRPRQLDFLWASGLVALVFSLGPQPRVFDRLLAVPLPYAWLEKAFPALSLGGCVNRFEQLALLALAVSFGLWLDRVRLRSAIGCVGVALLVVEYLPWRVPVERWPLQPPDLALVALAREPHESVVVDLDSGVAPMVRQLTHEHPIAAGYLSRNPLTSRRRVEEDPVLRVLRNAGAASPWEPAAVGAYLRYRYHAGFVLAPDGPAALARLGGLGLAKFASSDGRTLVMKVPVPPSAPEPGGPIEPESLANPGRDPNTIAFGVTGPSQERVGPTQMGVPLGDEAGFVTRARPGTYILDLHVPAPSFIPLVATWGTRERRIATGLYDTREYVLEVDREDLIADGWLGVTLRFPDGVGALPSPPVFLGFRRK